LGSFHDDHDAFGDGDLEKPWQSGFLQSYRVESAGDCKAVKCVERIETNCGAMRASASNMDVAGWELL
jgi:hypothetical protein